MMSREEAIRKAAALLRLAARPGTAGEAAAAAARAQSIMEKYEITNTAALDAPAEADEETMSFFDRAEGWLDSRSKALALWRILLARGIAQANGCYTFSADRGAGRSIEIIGRPSSVELVRYMYSWLSNEIERLSKEAGRGMGSVWIREFREGASEEVVRRIHEMRNQAAREVREEYRGNAAALVRIERGIATVERHLVAAEAVAGKYGLRTVSRRGGRRDDSARGEGRAAGRRIDLGAKRQIGG